MRVAIYCYVSTTEKEQEVCGQLIQMREYCEHHGLMIVGEFVDHENGKRKDRVKFRAMLDAAAQKAFDLLLFWALDELTRDGTLATLKYFQKLIGFGICWQSLAEPWIDTAGPLGDMIIRLVATLVKQERARSSKRIKAALARAARGGTRSGRSIGRPRVVLNNELALKLRRDGLSWNEIARHMGVSKSSIRRACRQLAE
jgi:DNA invertase Pin-like site-specific DNA recombinase